MANVGVIGIGAFGKLLCKKLDLSKHHITCKDPSSSTTAFCNENGFSLVDNYDDLLENNDYIFIALNNPKLSYDVAKELGKYAIENKFIIEMSLLQPEDSKKLNALYLSNNAKYIEATILGRAFNFDNWVVISAGDDEQCLHLEKNVFFDILRFKHVGEIGSAGPIKILNNTMFCMYSAAIGEVMCVAENAGIDKELFYRIISNTGATVNCEIFQEAAKRILKNDFGHPDTSINIVLKDNSFGLELARNAHVAPFLASSTLMLFENAANFGLRENDSAGIYEYLRYIYPEKKKD